jgi:hypothetical protein
MSLRVSTSRLERSCSSDMYAGEPRMALVPVSPSSVSWGAFAIPKSSTLTSGLPSARSIRNRLPGLRSRWTICAACASARPAHAWIR